MGRCAERRDRFDGVQFAHYTTEHGLPSNYVFQAIKDQHGNLWFGGHGGDGWLDSNGLTRFDGSHFVDFIEASNLPDIGIWDIVEEENGALWVSTNDGLFRCELYQCTRMDAIEALLRPDRLVLGVDRNDNVWIGGGNGGLVRYDGEKQVLIEGVLGVGRRGSIWAGFSAIHEDRDGILWFASYQGRLIRYDGTRFQ